MSKPNTEITQSIANWFHIAKPKPTNQNIVQQIAYHFEEVAEMFVAIKCYYEAELLENLKDELLSFDKRQCNDFIKHVNKLNLIDALCDQQVTAIGIGTLFDFDMPNALVEINKSNYSKFENGKPVINEQGKITKGKYYQEPQLTDYISLTDRQQRAKNKLKELLDLAETNTPTPYTSEKITVERTVTTIETYEIHPERLGTFIDCDECRLTVDFGQPTDEFYSDKRRVLTTNGDQE